MDRSFAVLELIAAQPSRIVDVTRALGLPWATVHRTMTQLERAQFLRKDPETNRFQIGPRLWHLGSAYLANHRVLATALPCLAQAGGIEGVAVQVAERIGWRAVPIYSAQPGAEDITRAHYGFDLPLHCGSKGQLLLAFETPEFIDAYLARDLERLTPDTVTDPARLRAILSEVRTRGVALTVGDVQPFTGSMSAPLRDSSGRVLAALCFVFRRTLLRNARRRDELLDQLQRTAHAVSIDLGWRPGQM